MKLAEELLNKYNCSTEENHCSNNELKYLWCCYSLLEDISRKLPETTMVISYCIQYSESIRHMLWNRTENLGILDKFSTTIEKIKFIQEFEKRYTLN